YRPPAGDRDAACAASCAAFRHALLTYIITMTTTSSSACAIQNFDCVASLARFVGQPAITSAPLLLDQKMIGQFAQVTHDHQWIHVDPARAKTQSPYQHTIAHGF